MRKAGDELDPEHPENHEVARLLREWREAAGLTQGELGVLLNTTQPSIARMEKGTTRTPAPRLLEWAHACGRDLRLATGAPAEPPPAPAEPAVRVRLGTEAAMKRLAALTDEDLGLLGEVVDVLPVARRARRRLRFELDMWREEAEDQRARNIMGQLLTQAGQGMLSEKAETLDEIARALGLPAPASAPSKGRREEG